MAVGVPGTVAGLEAIHKKFGTLPWKDLVQPAIDLALNGYRVTAKQQLSFDSKKDEFIEMNGENTFYAKGFKAGDWVKNRALANTLGRIAKNGSAGFYEGVNADAMIKRIKETGGVMTAEDLLAYKPVWRDPIHIKYEDLDLYSMAPPSSGGICLGQIMKMIEPFNLKSFGHNSTDYIKLLVEAERRSFADRSHFLGDPDFISIPTKRLTSTDYLNNRMKDFSFEKPTDSNDIGHGNIDIHESNETTHYSIVDQFGNAIAVTTTLNGTFGSKLFSNELGFFLNNEMDDFSSKPGYPNMYGLIGGEANKIEPKKSPLSSMSPVIVTKDNIPYLITGSPGGSTIINSVFQEIINILDFEMSLEESSNKNRIHYQWQPDIVFYEDLKKDIVERLENDFILRKRKLGEIQSILKTLDGYKGYSDSRRPDGKSIEIH